jgi:His/Glu/Gln/Arg/opine family amino acid ABC transporter permease subunit
MLAKAQIEFNWNVVWDNRDALLAGLRTALWVALVAMIISLFTGTFVALLRMSRIKPVSWLASIYINVFRGMPALVTVIWVYFGLSIFIGVNFTVFQAGVIALTLLYTAFLSEIFRAALLAVPSGQREAALSLGMSRPRVFVSAVLPQAAKIAVPSTGSMFIGMVKDTSVFAVIGLFEVVRTTQKLVSDTFRPFELWTAAAILYVVVAFVLDFIFRRVEKRLSGAEGRKTRGPLARHRAKQVAALEEAVRTGKQRSGALAPALAGATAAGPNHQINDHLDQSRGKGEGSAHA